MVAIVWQWVRANPAAHPERTTAMSDELPLIDCRGTRFCLIARNNRPGKAPGTEDMFIGEWFMTPQDAISAFEKGPVRWMKWSFALLIERCDGVRMWAHSTEAPEASRDAKLS